MIIADLPPSEAFRLVDLASYEIMDSGEEDDFNELVELASQICNSPISLITLLDKERQWLKAKKGTPLEDMPRDLAFCSHAILQDEVMIVEDASRDKRFINHPFVTGTENIRFYAGAPIMSPGGYKLGTICVLDTQPRKLSAKEERALVILSHQVTKLLELRKKNMLIRERAAEVINIKSNAISSVLQGQEDEKKAIACNLHEDMAQSIASSIFLLQTAQNDVRQAPELVQTTKNQLRDVLRNMQALSYSITPHVIDLLPANELVKEYAEKIAATYAFSIRLSTDGDPGNGTSDNAVNSIRIIEKWLKILAEKKDVSIVKITVLTYQYFELLIEDDGHRVSFEASKKKIFDSLVFERAAACGGTVEWSQSATGKNILKVKLPFASSNRNMSVVAGVV